MKKDNKSTESNSNKIFNPFEGRNADEVWKELLTNSKPISREEMFRQIQEQKRQAEEKRKDESTEKP